MAEEQKGKNMIKLDMGNIDGGLSKYVEIQRGVSEMKSIKSEDMPDVLNRIFQGAKNGIREKFILEGGLTSGGEPKEMNNIKTKYLEQNDTFKIYWTDESEVRREIGFSGRISVGFMRDADSGRQSLVIVDTVKRNDGSTRQVVRRYTPNVE